MNSSQTGPQLTTPELAALTSLDLDSEDPFGPLTRGHSTTLRNLAGKGLIQRRKGVVGRGRPRPSAYELTSAGLIARANAIDLSAPRVYTAFLISVDGGTFTLAVTHGREQNVAFVRKDTVWTDTFTLPAELPELPVGSDVRFPRPDLRALMNERLLDFGWIPEGEDWIESGIYPASRRVEPTLQDPVEVAAAQEAAEADDKLQQRQVDLVAAALSDAGHTRFTIDHAGPVVRLIEPGCVEVHHHRLGITRPTAEHARRVSEYFQELELAGFTVGGNGPYSVIVHTDADDLRSVEEREDLIDPKHAEAYVCMIKETYGFPVEALPAIRRMVHGRGLPALQAFVDAFPPLSV